MHRCVHPNNHWRKLAQQRIQRRANMFYRFRSGSIGLTLIILLLHTRIKETLSDASMHSPPHPAAADAVSDDTLKSLSALYTSSASTAPAASAASAANILPYFDFDVQRNLTVTVGQTGFLHCRVERLGDKDVSWIRKRDLHILTAGVTVYTSDQRFQVNRPKNSSNWTLQIKYPQLRDAGVYECQINTEPKMSLFYTFNVVELKANILGPTDLYVKSGSDINLTCNISQGPHELGNIFWYKGTEIVDMVASVNEIHTDSSAPRITVDTDWADGLISRLKIRRATVNDTGNYSCVPTIAKPSSASVHVINGEFPAAMQHNAAAPSVSSSSGWSPAILVAIAAAVVAAAGAATPSNEHRQRQPSGTVAARVARKVLRMAVQLLAALVSDGGRGRRAKTTRHGIYQRRRRWLNGGQTHYSSNTEEDEEDVANTISTDEKRQTDAETPTTPPTSPPTTPTTTTLTTSSATR